MEMNMELFLHCQESSYHIQHTPMRNQFLPNEPPWPLGVHEAKTSLVQAFPQPNQQLIWPFHQKTNVRETLFSFFVQKEKEMEEERTIRQATFVRRGIADAFEHKYANSKDGREAFILRISAIPNQVETDELTRTIPAIHEIFRIQVGLQ